jgi:hypothetical protein
MGWDEWSEVEERDGENEREVVLAGEDDKSEIN